MRVVRDSKGKRKDVRASIERNDAKCIEKKALYAGIHGIERVSSEVLK
jgi:hypothetical protein